MILVLSPHLDDAVFSLPHHLQGWGSRALVVTLFSRTRDEEVRKAEDRRALALLGVGRRWLDLPDAPLRGRESTFALLSAPRRPPEMATTIPLVAQLIQQLEPELIVAPLAAGGHIDHRLTLDAALAGAGAHPVVFYEDRPYAQDPGTVSLARRRLGDPYGPGGSGPDQLLRHLGVSRVAATLTGIAHTLRPAIAEVGPLNSRLRRFEPTPAVTQAVAAYASQAAFAPALPGWERLWFSAGIVL